LKDTSPTCVQFFYDMERQHYFRNMLLDILRKILFKHETSRSHKGADQIQGFWNANSCRLVNSYGHWLGSRCPQKVAIELLQLEEEGSDKW
jgi:hypothetical protein